MIAYDIESLAYLDPGKISSEDIKGFNDLLATMLCTSYESLMDDLDKEFTSTELLSTRPYGKIDLEKSYKTGVISRGQMYCDVNTEDNNSIYNQVIKATFRLIRDCTGVSKGCIKRIDKNIKTLSDVDDIEIYRELLDHITGIPKRYEHIWVLVILIVNMWFIYDEQGKYNLLELNDKDKISMIFEHFGVNFGRLMFRGGRTTKPVYPVMTEYGGNKVSRRNRLDMMLKNKHSVAIIDFKFYDKADTVGDSGNVREVTDYATSFYEMDKDRDKYNNITCILLYASKKNVKEIYKLQESREINGKNCRIYKATVNLNQDFDKIKDRLLWIYGEALKVQVKSGDLYGGNR